MIEFTNLVLRRTLEESSLKPVNAVTVGDSLKKTRELLLPWRNFSRTY
jgi:hypothetical protein